MKNLRYPTQLKMKQNWDGLFNNLKVYGLSKFLLWKIIQEFYQLVLYK